MGQTKEGAAKAQATLRARYGDNYFTLRASNGGKISKTGFKKGSQNAINAGIKSGIAKRKAKANQA